MRIILGLLCLGLSLSHTFAFYERSDVVELTPTTFKARVLDSNEVWIVEFCEFGSLSMTIIRNSNLEFFGNTSNTKRQLTNRLLSSPKNDQMLLGVATVKRSCLSTARQPPL